MIEFLRKITKQDIRNTITIFWVILSFIFLFKLLSKAIPVENKDVVMTIAGVVIGQLVVIIAYYFGQSKIDNDATKYKNDHTNHNN